MKKLVISLLFVMNVFFVFAQTGTGVSGKVVNSKTQKPLQNVVVSIQNTNLTQVTDADGKFVFKDVSAGSRLLLIKSNGFKDQLLAVDFEKGKILDLGVVVLDEDLIQDQQNRIITIIDNDLGDDNSGSESTASLLQASRDVFQQAAAFNWGDARFRARGLDGENGTTMINGISMNKIYDGRPQYGNWGGLNDATRNQEFTNGSSPSDYTFGGILGTQEINTRASLYRAGNRITGSVTNTNYSGRIMGTMASGMRKDGWAYVISASRRFAQEGFFDGTTYNANSFFGSLERRLTSNNSLNLTTIFAQNRRGKSSPNSQEVTDLTSYKYNSYWGWQNGEKRNSRIKDVEEPIFILSDYWKITPKTNLNMNVAYQFGKVGNSRLDYQGSNPDPTYYRNLPSYYTSLYEEDPATVLLSDPSVYNPGGLGGIPTPDYAAATDPASAKFLANQQIDWANLYAINKLTGTSRYVQYEDRTDDKTLTANMVLSSSLSDHVFFNGSANFTKLKSHNFKNLLDLLGGTSYTDYSQYGIGDQHQNDLNNPFRVIGVGDTYGYNFNLNAITYNGFTQFKFTYKKVDFYAAQTYSHSEYQREGLYRNGYYPNSSFGESNKISFDNFGFKGGLTYKLSGRSFFTANGAILTKAPSLRDVFSNARVNNNITRDVTSALITSADVSYIYNAAKLKTRLTAYISQMKNLTETSFYYAEGIFGTNAGGADPNAFVSEILTNVSKRNIGAEFGLEYPVTSTIKVTAAAAYGQFIYDNNPNLRITSDQFSTSTISQEAHIKNYKQSGTPQAAGSFGLEYRDPKFWSVRADVNYIAQNYIDIAPILRTDRFYTDPLSVNESAFPEATQERGDQLLKQERFDNFALLNFSASKSWKIKDLLLGLNASVDNVLDQVYKTGGYEQARNSNYRQLNQDVSSGTPSFAPKYFYGYGRTFFLNVYLNF